MQVMQPAAGETPKAANDMVDPEPTVESIDEESGAPVNNIVEEADDSDEEAPADAVAPNQPVQAVQVPPPAAAQPQAVQGPAAQPAQNGLNRFGFARRPVSHNYSMAAIQHVCDANARIQCNTPLGRTQYWICGEANCRNINFACRSRCNKSRQGNPCGSSRLGQYFAGTHARCIAVWQRNNF